MSAAERGGRPASRTYDREELDLILRAAAESQESLVAPVLPPVVRDGLSLAEIQDIGAQVGISRDAIATATLRVALESAHNGQPGWHHVQHVAGALDSAALAQLADDIRSLAGTVDVRRTSDGLELEIHKRSGELGQLLVSIRTAEGATIISAWSTAPHLGPVELAVCGALGMPAAIFPAVATAGGQWPVLSSLAVLGGIGFVAGTGVTLAWQRWATKRWRSRLISILTPVVARATALAAARSARDDDE